jgi:hypothetical protein
MYAGSARQMNLTWCGRCPTFVVIWTESRREGQDGTDAGAGTASAAERQPATKRRATVFQPSQAIGARNARLANPIVGHFDSQLSGLGPSGHVGAAGLRVLDRVGESFAYDEVGGRLDRRGKPLVRHINRQRQRHPWDEAIDGGTQASVQHGRKDAVCQLAWLDVGLLGLLRCLLHQFPRLGAVVFERDAGKLEHEDRADEALLGSIV